jgi:antirestriction protein
MELRELYIQCLRAYNQGIIHGDWIDLHECEDLEHLYKKCQEIIFSSPAQGAEEYAIFDDQGFYRLLHYPYPDIAIAWCIHEHFLDAEKENIDLHLFAKWLEIEKNGYYCEDFHVSDFQASYRGEYHSIEDYAEECSDLGKEKSMILEYFDYKRYGHDMELEGSIWTIDHNCKVHIFDNYY